MSHYVMTMASYKRRPATNGRTMACPWHAMACHGRVLRSSDAHSYCSIHYCPPPPPISVTQSFPSSHFSRSSFLLFLLLFLPPPLMSPCPPPFFTSFLLFILLFPPLTFAYYFVLTKYSPLKSASLSSGVNRFLSSVSSQTKEVDREWTVGMNTLGDENQFWGDTNWEETTDKVAMVAKRSIQSLPPVPEYACNTIILTDYRPQFGFEQNGTRVEIQQDERRQFSATFVKCANSRNVNCRGIDNANFSSECVTLYEFRPAGVRVERNSGEFVEGFIRVPITCQCRLRRRERIYTI